jgi:glycerophosphoryl diester phosphodiesterase
VTGARIPTLEEIFAMVEASKYPAAAKVEFNMETKSFPGEPKLAPSPAEFAKMVTEIVKRHGMEKRTIVQSFDVRTLREIKKIEPEIRTSQLTGEELVDIVPALKSARADIWSPNYKWITAASIREAHAAGIQVAPWTINTPEEWDMAIAAGVDAIITDYPEDLIYYLKAKKLRP